MGKFICIFVCLVILGLDIIAGILGIKAEAAQNQVKHLKLWIFECKEPSELAFKLGLGASVLLTIAHVIANLVGGFSVCAPQDFHKPSSTNVNRQIPLACLVLTWVVVGIGLGLLVIGTLSNNKSRGSCGMTHRHFLSLGGIACMVHALLAVAYYVVVTASSSDK